MEASKCEKSRPKELIRPRQIVYLFDQDDCGREPACVCVHHGHHCGYHHAASALPLDIPRADLDRTEVLQIPLHHESHRSSGLCRDPEKLHLYPTDAGLKAFATS